MQEKVSKLGQGCFWLGLIIETLLVMIDKSAYINPYEGFIFRMTFLLFCIKIATTKYTKQEWICMILIGIIAMISYFVNSKDEIVRVVVFIAACKGIDLKKQLKTILAITAGCSVILFVLAATGIFGWMSVTADFGRGQAGVILEETRYCFGMGHPNAFHCMMLMMTILVLYLYCESMEWYHFGILLGFHYLCYRYTDSNTSMLIAVCIIVGCMVMKYIPVLQKIKIIYILGTVMVLGVVIFSMIGAHTGNGTPIMYKIDKILNGRFQYSYIYENVHLENWKIFAASANEEYFDQGFLRLFYWYGIIPALLYIAMNLYLILQSFRKRDYTLLVIIVGLSIYMIMEAHLISIYILRNYLFIWIGYYWLLPFEENGNVEGYFWQVKKVLKKI